MAAKESREIEPGRERWERSQQSAQWREIGISAVAAAARFNATEAPATTAVPTPAEASPRKIVTLKDIEFVVA